MKKMHSSVNRIIATVLVLACLLGLLPTAALAAAPGTITLTKCDQTKESYTSPALGSCRLHTLTFDYNGGAKVGFCADHGKGMGWSLEGQPWDSAAPISDPTVKNMMAYYYAHTTGIFTDEAHASGEDELWDAHHASIMNAWVQAVIWRYKTGTLNDPATASAEELMNAYNCLEGTTYRSIDDVIYGNTSFRDFAQYVLDRGIQGVWGNCEVYEYRYAGASTDYQQAGNVQGIIIGELSVTTTTQDPYSLTVKKVDATDPGRTLPGASFLVTSDAGFSKAITVGGDGTYTLRDLEASTYTIFETSAPEGYEIDPTPQYVTLPGASNTVTVTFMDTPEDPGEGTIRKVDADNPTKGLPGAVIKITGVDNDFVGTYTTGDGGYLTDVPWDKFPKGSFTAEEVTPPEGYTMSPDTNKVKQTFEWDGKTDVALVFENDAKVKVKLIKLDDSGNPLPGAVFNIFKDGQIVGTEATQADGSITVTDVTEGLYAFLEVSAPEPFARLTEPVLAYVDQATINGGGTVTVTATDKKLPSLTILKKDGQSGNVIPGTTFEVKAIDGSYHNDVVTGVGGKATLSHVPVGSFEVTEKSVPDPYTLGEVTTQTIYLGPGDNRELVFDNLKRPEITISKVELGSGIGIPGTVFSVSGIDSDYRHDVTTGVNGTVTLRVAPGSYRILEKFVPEPYCLPGNESDCVQTVSLNPGDSKELIFKNAKKPLLTLSKIDADSQEPIPNTVLTVKALDGTYQDDWKTGPYGTVSLRVEPGVYEVTEKSVPSPYYVPDKDADRTQTITLSPGDEKTLVFRNRKAPELTILKENSITGEAIEHAKFHITYTSNGEAAEAPATIDYGTAFTDARGEIKVHELGKRLYPGEFTITEVEPADGFQLKEPLTQTVIIHGNESKTVRFQNTPLSALVVWKYDSVTSAPVEGAIFQVKYMSGTRAPAAR